MAAKQVVDWCLGGFCESKVAIFLDPGPIVNLYSEGDGLVVKHVAFDLRL